MFEILHLLSQLNCFKRNSIEFSETGKFILENLIEAVNSRRTAWTRLPFKYRKLVSIEDLLGIFGFFPSNESRFIYAAKVHRRFQSLPESEIPQFIHISKRLKNARPGKSDEFWWTSKYDQYSSISSRSYFFKMWNPIWVCHHECMLWVKYKCLKFFFLINDF